MCAMQPETIVRDSSGRLEPTGPGDLLWLTFQAVHAIEAGHYVPNTLVAWYRSHAQTVCYRP
jgi:hypothetical protein